jgi:hypothetical protein
LGQTSSDLAGSGFLCGVGDVAEVVGLQKENIERAEMLTSSLRYMSGVADEVKKLKDAT